MAWFWGFFQRWVWVTETLDKYEFTSNKHVRISFEADDRLLFIDYCFVMVHHILLHEYFNEAEVPTGFAVSCGEGYGKVFSNAKGSVGACSGAMLA